MPSLSNLCFFQRPRRQKVTTRDAAQGPRMHNHGNAVGEQPQDQPGQAQNTPAPSSGSTVVSNIPITVESLPAELRHEILSLVVDIKDLKALVLASPVFHQQYLLDRKAFLRRVLNATLRNVLVDAYAVRTSALLHEQQPRNGLYHLEKTTVRLFMDNYVALRSMSPDRLLAEVIIAEDNLAAMANFYCSVTRPLVEEFARLFLHHLEPSLRVGNLSRVERTRLLRALYRFQLYCNLFGVGPRGYCIEPPLPMTEILATFFCVFRPWEIEEIDCIYVIIRGKYEAVFDTIRSDVARDNPRFDGWPRPDTPPGSFDLASEYNRESLRQGTASQGLRVFSKALSTSDHEELVRHMQEYLTPRPIFIEPVLGWTNQDFRRREYPSEEDRAEARHERLPFPGDKEDAPPLAWVIIWRGKYVNEYGSVIDHDLKTWGYVFWDCERLNESGGKKRLRVQQG